MKSKSKILKRAFILLILSDRGLLEKEFHAGGQYSWGQREEKRKQFVKIAKDRDFLNEFLNSEKDILNAKVGTLNEETFSFTQFQYESIQVLLWSLNIVDFPKYEDKFYLIDFHDYIGKYGTNNFKLNIELQKLIDIKLMNNISMLWHWRAREGIKNKVFKNIDLKVEIPKIFGNEYNECLIKIPFSKKKPVDFLYNNILFNNIPQRKFELLSFRIKWIHHATEWLLNDDSWEDTDTST